MAWLLFRLRDGLRLRAGAPTARAVTWAAIVGVLASSYIGHQSAELITAYTAARFKLVSANSVDGIELLERVVVSDSQIVDLEDAYSRLAFQRLGGERGPAVLSEGLARYPGNARLRMYADVQQALSEESVRRREALQRLRGVLATAADEQLSAGIKTTLSGAFLNYGGNAEERQDLEVAIRAYRLALQFDPGRAKAGKRLHTALLQAGRTAEAATAAREWSRSHNRDPQATLDLAEALFAAGEPDEAAAALEHARSLGPDDFPVVERAGTLALENGLDEQGLDAYRDAARLGETHVGALGRSGTADELYDVYMKLFRVRRALAACGESR